MDLNGMTAAVYLRKSRAEEGLSVEEVLSRHRETLTEFAARNGIRIVEIFQEVKSGESLYARPEMGRLLEAVEAGRFQAVLCMDIDRLSRGETQERGIIWATFKNAGTLIVTPSKTYNLSEESDEMMTEFYGLFASMELRQIKKRLSAGKERSIREGYYISCPPYGYRRAMIGKRPTLEIYEPEARFVRLAFEWYASGMGCYVIADRLTALGARPHKCAAFKRVSVVGMLKNPVYAGKIAYNRTKVTKKAGSSGVKTVIKKRPEEERILTDGLHPAIVEQELFDLCQKQMRERAKPPTRDNIIRSPFRGLVRCEKCGRLVQRMPQRGAEYMRCPTRGCGMGIKWEHFEAAVLGALEDMLAALKSETNGGGKETAALEAELSVVNAALKEAESRRALLFDLLEDGTYSRADFTARMETLKERVATLRRNAGEIAGRLDAVRKADRQQQAEKIRNALDAYDTTDVAGKNALLREVVERIWCYRAKGTKPLEFTVRIVPKF